MERLSLKSVNGGKMMKRITCILRLLLSFTLCFTADFKVIRDTKIYDGDYNYMGDLKKGQIVQLWDCSVRNQSNNDKLNFNYSLRLKIDGKKRLVDACSIVPAETKDLFDNSVNYIFLCKDNKKYISKENIDILATGSRKSFEKKYQERIYKYEKNKDLWNEDSHWYDVMNEPSCAIITNTICIFDSLNDDYFCFVKKIEKTDYGYKVVLETADYYVSKTEVEYSNSILKSFFSVGYEVELKFIVDGNYLYIYTVDDNLLFTYAIVDSNFETEYSNLIKYDTVNLNKITWPRHADGTCDYETAVRLQSGKRYRASDNLRLRSSGSTAGKPVVTIGKGTQVKVIAVGAEQTIDGITSNWVQVEVQAGAKDRDGKAIAAGTTGWCFGGYLAER